jgi:hypothetical protein
VVGEHDGYTRLDDPVVHRRTVALDGTARTLVVQDEVQAAGPHDVDLFFHFSEECTIAAGSGPRREVSLPGLRLAVETDPRLAVAVLVGSEEPKGGWVSRGYHRKAPAPTLVGRARLAGSATLVTRFTLRD